MCVKCVIKCDDIHNLKLEALGERRPPPSGAVACAKTRFNLAFRLYRPERHQNLISSYLSITIHNITSSADVITLVNIEKCFLSKQKLKGIQILSFFSLPQNISPLYGPSLPYY